jgi:hypothetical protein
MHFSFAFGAFMAPLLMRLNESLKNAAVVPGTELVGEGTYNETFFFIAGDYDSVEL